MSRGALVCLLLALLGLAGWIGGVLAYVNWFGETGRAGGDAVKVAMWCSALVGVGALAGFGFLTQRGRRA